MSTAIGLRTRAIVFLVVALFVSIAALIYTSQILLERATESANSPKEELEISKLDAEIAKLRSDTLGSLFWLKLIALFVTVGGAVGGYLVGQDQATRARIEFENRKNVDSAYQSIIKELSDSSAVLRAAAAVKLGTILRTFPAEWTVSDLRKSQLIQLTKQILAAALSIESNDKVLKTLSINLILHKPCGDDTSNSSEPTYADARKLDLSGTKAADAYWAKTDFTYTDFYKADLKRTSFRKSILVGAQFRESILAETVFAEANCESAEFKMSDLRGANFRKAKLHGAGFKDSKVCGADFTDAEGIDCVPDVMVDNSSDGDGTEMVHISKVLGGAQTNGKQPKE